MNGSPQTYTYFKNGANPLNGQRLSNDGVNAYTWDANGSNLTRSGAPGSFTFGYNVDNRLNSISGAATASYTYDYQGRRTSKTASGTTTTYLYDGLNLVGETTGGTVTNYAFGPGIDEPLIVNKAGAISYFNADGLGSVAGTNSPAGTFDYNSIFDAWGSVRSETGTRTNSFTYTGREVGEAGLHFYRARFLDPVRGRFTQEDPIASPAGLAQYALMVRTISAQPADPMATSGGLNLAALIRNMPAYTYARSNPVIFSDPTGLYCCTQSFLDCFGECLKAGDPLPDWAKPPLLLGTPIPKAWLGQPQALGSQPYTGLGSYWTRMGGPGWARSAGAAFNYAFMGYGLGMFGIEAICAAACAYDHCMFLP